MGRQLQLIAEGVGTGIVARRVLSPTSEEQGLQAFRIAGMSFSLTVWLFHRRNGPIIPVVMPVLATSRYGTVAVSKPQAPLAPAYFGKWLAFCYKHGGETCIFGQTFHDIGKGSYGHHTTH